MRTDWKIEKAAGKKKLAWALRYRPAGYSWETMGHYPTKRAAFTIAMLMRDRGDRITWQGPAMRLGILCVEPHKLDD